MDFIWGRGAGQHTADPNGAGGAGLYFKILDLKQPNHHCLLDQHHLSLLPQQVKVHPSNNQDPLLHKDFLRLKLHGGSRTLGCQKPDTGSCAGRPCSYGARDMHAAGSNQGGNRYNHRGTVSRQGTGGVGKMAVSVVMFTRGCDQIPGDDGRGGAQNSRRSFAVRLGRRHHIYPLARRKSASGCRAKHCSCMHQACLVRPA